MPDMANESVRGIDTVGLRVLNTYRLEDRSLRVATARSIYDSAPDGEIELLTPVVREAIRDACFTTNKRIETEWFREPVPGLCFGTDVATPAGSPPSTRALLDYLDRVVALCEAARKSDAEKTTA